LARRLRPQKFAAVLGQEHVTRSLQSALTTGRLAHAYLFCGARGVGKTSVARILARALNCASFPAPEPCGECPACLEMASGQAVDFLEIDGASNNSVDDVRELRQNVRYLPAHGRYKIYLIDEVHMLSTAAFNALLKTLEEPPPHVAFIFATTSPQKVPATILSRCQRYDFRRLPEELIAAELIRICAAEGREIEAEGAALIAREAEGSLRDALSLLEQVFASWNAGEPGTAARVAEALGLIDRRLVADAFAAVVDADAARLLDIAADLHAFGQDAEQFCQLLLSHVRDALAARLLSGRPADLPRLVHATPKELAELVEVAARVSQETLQLYFDILMEGVVRIRRSGNPRLTLEMTLLRLATLEPAVPLGDILAKLARLEERLAQDRIGEAAGQPGLFEGGAQATKPAPAKTPVVAPAKVAVSKAALPKAPAGGASAGDEPRAEEPGADVPRADVPRAAPEPAPQAVEEAGSEAIEDDGVLDRMRSWAEEQDGILLAGLREAATGGGVLALTPGFFEPDDLLRRARACLEALGLALEVRINKGPAAAGAQRPAARQATLQDVYAIFGPKPRQ
jgi:DNA polymerase-3 subunit gamma/tau